MIVAFSPYPTRVLADTLRTGSRAGAFAYGLTFFAMAITFGLLWTYAAVHHRLLRSDADRRTITGISRSFRPGAAMYATATVSSLLSPYLAVALYAAIALFYVVESSVFGRGELTASGSRAAG